MGSNQPDPETNHPSFLALDRAHLGRPAPEVAAHLAECDACRLYLGSLAEPDFLPSLTEIQRTLARPRRRFSWSWLLAPASLAAAAGCVFLFVAHRDLNAPRAQDAYVGAKGFRSVWIYVRRGTETVLWDGKQPVAAGDRVRLKIDAGSYHRVEVYSLSASQIPTRVYQSAISPGQNLTLPEAWEIDDSPEAEQLFVVFSDAPVTPTWDAWRQGRVQPGVAVLPFLLLVCMWTANGAATASEIRKVAVVVGANLAPPGRVQLRYAHEDARRVVEVLTAVGGFNARDIQRLLDPSPAELLAALDRELALAGQRSEQTLLFFFYSGHADDHSLFPNGEPLAFATLKTRLEDPRAKLRIGVLDSCRGGSWTGTKGLKKADPFEIDTLPTLAEEGSVLIASSSGRESAHETEALQGSFFTHHWNAGLRGAADRGGDGVVTLSEAFEYARSLTIRDTALIGQEPQHPSFQMKLTGRQDFPLATLANQRTTLWYEQATGPTEFVRLNDGLVVAETPPGARRVRLGLPAGSYLVRRRAADGVFVRIVTLSAGGGAVLAEADLTRSTLAAGRSKGVESYEPSGISWLGQRFFGSLAAGIRHAPVIDPGLRLGAADGDGVVLLRISARLTRKLWWSGPLALVYDAERADAFNWLVWAGVPVLSGSHPDGRYVLSGSAGAGVDARFRQSERHTFNLSLSELSAFEWAQHWPGTFTTQLTLGMSETIPAAITFNFGVGLSANAIIDGHFSSASIDANERATVIAFGSVQRAGLRPLPLIHVPLGGGLGVDAYAVAGYLPAKQGWVETYLAGVSFVH